MQQQFYKALKDVKRLRVQQMPWADHLDLYGSFKQATEGNVNTHRPRGQKERAEWDIWYYKWGQNPEEATQNFVNRVNYLIRRYGMY